MIDATPLDLSQSVSQVWSPFVCLKHLDA